MLKRDVFLNNFAKLARDSELGLGQKMALAAAEREVRELRRLRRAVPRAARVVKRRVPPAPKQVTSECKICHLPWPHLTKWERSRHGYALVRRRGTRARQRLLAGGQPWGEKFREMGRAAMAQKYTRVRVDIFKEVAPRAFELFGQRFVEELINRRKHHYVKDSRAQFRRWVGLHYGGQRLKKPWVKLPPRPGRDAQGFKIR